MFAARSLSEILELTDRATSITGATGIIAIDRRADATASDLRTAVRIPLG